MAAKGWFRIADIPGDRDLAQQLIGLDALWPELPGATVLDVGCAEGLITLECLRAGARRAIGIDVYRPHIARARGMRGRLPVAFELADASVYEPQERFDVVLMLAVLHKLPDPSGTAARLASCAKRLCVVRYPGASDGRVIVDARSGSVEHDVDGAILASGFACERRVAGPFDEPTVFYRRA